ncbi:MAG: hypothetical protein F9K31_00035 [Dokdonella sp.]|nr:MAG: hypothetical protein F9K31_00035 [Dokdonella sp.]
MNTPTTIREYLEQLRAALAGADPALVQDALYDAEDHLRSEMADHPDTPEAELLAKIVNSYGAPAEVAGIYVDKERVVEQALRPPPPRVRRSLAGRFFGVAADPRTYAALFYMLLSLATGVFYFTWVVTGLSLSVGLSVLIIGVLVPIAFFASVRVLALVEGRIVEVMLGERMPRRPVYAQQHLPLLRRIGAMFSDPRSWSTILYLVLMLPLGICYFTMAVTGIAVSLGLVFLPVLQVLVASGVIEGHVGFVVDGVETGWGPWWFATPLTFVAGVLLLFATLHLARGVARVQGALAKHLLVQSAR